MKTFYTIAAALFITTGAASAQSADPRYTNDGQLIRPDNYREWVYLSSGLGMTYGFVEKAVNAVVGERFDNVFVTPQAYRAFLQTGTWPDKTMFVLEVRSSSTNGSINKGGHYQDELVGVEAHVKDTTRFASGWAFFDLGTARSAAKPLPANSACQTCHAAHGGVESTFVQFYPTLIPIAKAHGTFKANEPR
jgi:cytochrome P460